MLERFPLLVWAGAMLLGWIAGDILATDPALTEVFGEGISDRAQIVLSLAGAITVPLVALLWRHIRRPVKDAV